MKVPKHPADEARQHYLQLCEAIIEHVQAMRGLAMKPGNAWLAQAELTKISTLISELEDRLDKVKQLDERST